jgi:hypothetical protein
MSGTHAVLIYGVTAPVGFESHLSAIARKLRSAR